MNYDEAPSKEDLKSLRMAYNMTQVKFAQLIGVEFVTYSRWERGLVTPSPMGRRRLRELREKKMKDYDHLKEYLQSKRP